MSGTITLQDKSGDFEVDAEFADRVLDLFRRRSPSTVTRYEIQELLKIQPKTVKEEISQMFNAYSKGETW